MLGSGKSSSKMNPRRALLIASLCSPLHPGACLTAELKFVALTSGALHIEAVRIVDVGTNETIYVRDLPDIVASPKATE